MCDSVNRWAYIKRKATFVTISFKKRAELICEGGPILGRLQYSTPRSDVLDPKTSLVPKSLSPVLCGTVKHPCYLVSTASNGKLGGGPQNERLPKTKTHFGLLAWSGDP